MSSGRGARIGMKILRDPNSQADGKREMWEGCRAAINRAVRLAQYGKLELITELIEAGSGRM